MEYIAHKETRRGMKIEIVQHDMYGRCPMDDGDCYQPMLVAGTGIIGQAKLKDPINYLTAEESTKKIAALLDAMDIDHAEFHQEVRDLAEENGWPFPNVEHFDDMVSERYSQLIPSVSSDLTNDQLKLMADLYRACGIPAQVFNFHGHSKGDYLTILVVEPNDWRERVGAPERNLTSDDPEINGESDMRGTAQTYADWAFGDTYGFRVTDPTNEDREDSCYGFIGSYMSEGWNYMLSESRDAADVLADERDSEIAATIIDTRPDLYQLAA